MRRNVWLGIWLGVATGISGVFAMSTLLAATIDVDATVPDQGSCFVAGTLVELADGSRRPIEDIAVGDSVMSWDPQTGTATAAPVVTRFVHSTDTYLVVNDQLRVTPNHPLLINGAWRRADSLRRGDWLQRLDGSLELVRTVSVSGGPATTVFNLEVAGTHTYYADGYVVHNKGGCTPGGLSCVADACSGGIKVLHCNDGCSDSTQTVACGCGDGTLDPGEGCDDSNLSGGDGCSPACQPENCGNGIITPPEQCDSGVGNSDVAANTCRTNCQNPSCGDGVVDTGEECDAGGANSDTTPNACRLDCQNPVCGDGVVDSGNGESCDDGNTLYATGEACSATCTPGLQITSHTVPTIGATTATATWISSIAGDSLLEWGPMQPGPTGCNYPLPSSATNPAAVTNHSLPMSGLTPATVYCYRVTSASGTVSDSILDTFQTTGAPNEICTDGIDNNNNGLCDYAASTCTDGSTPGDSACVCTPNYNCTAGACINGVETLTCTDQASCQLPYTTQQGCTPQCQLTCGPGEQLDVNSCTCQATGPYCGNGSCEAPTEDPFTCPQDCPVDCLPDWQCGPWGACTNGVENRDCVDGNACGSPLGQPDNQQSCTPGCSLTCGPAEQLDVNSCTCTPIVPFCGNAACEIGESHATCPQDCVPLCTPQWVCGSWGACVGGSQRRDCSDVAACGLDVGKPPTVLACGGECGAACGVCQQLNTSACSCDPIAGCCGNRSCEPGETKDSCPTDCGVPPSFTIAISVCQDGDDNDGDGLVDYPQDPGCRTSRDTTELNTLESVQQILDNPVVEEVNTRLAAPAAIGLVALNVATAVSFADLFSLLSYFFLQPLAILRRRTRKKWGVVYNALTKQPVDLAIVRLYRKDTGTLAQSRVTDREGRYDFLAEPGEYYITVTKPKFTFPSKYLHGKKRDVKFLDLYFGDTVRVTEEHSVITANIPVDPIDQTIKTPRRVYLQHYARKLQTGMAFIGVPLALVSFIISPGWLTGAFLGIHCIAFVLFLRLAFQRPPKSWGIVYDKKTHKPLARAVTRIYDTTYNKLLETRITDGRGRYAFLVDSNSYYVTAEHPGYVPTTTPPLDLTNKKREAIVNLDIPLFNDKGVGTAAEVSPASAAAAVPPAGTPAAIADSAGVGRESLEAIRDRKAPTPTVTLVTPTIETTKRSKATLSIFGNPVTAADPKAVAEAKEVPTEKPEKIEKPDQSSTPPGGKPSIFG